MFRLCVIFVFACQDLVVLDSGAPPAYAPSSAELWVYLSSSGSVRVFAHHVDPSRPEWFLFPNGDRVFLFRYPVSLDDLDLEPGRVQPAAPEDGGLLLPRTEEQFTVAQDGNGRWAWIPLETRPPQLNELRLPLRPCVELGGCYFEDGSEACSLECALDVSTPASPRAPSPSIRDCPDGWETSFVDLPASFPGAVQPDAASSTRCRPPAPWVPCPPGHAQPASSAECIPLSICDQQEQAGALRSVLQSGAGRAVYVERLLPNAPDGPLYPDFETALEEVQRGDVLVLPPGAFRLPTTGPEVTFLGHCAGPEGTTIQLSGEVSWPEVSLRRVQIAGALRLNGNVEAHQVEWIVDSGTGMRLQEGASLFVQAGRIRAESGASARLRWQVAGSLFLEGVDWEHVGLHVTGRLHLEDVRQRAPLPGIVFDGQEWTAEASELGGSVVHCGGQGSLKDVSGSRRERPSPISENAPCPVPWMATLSCDGEPFSAFSFEQVPDLERFLKECPEEEPDCADPEPTLCTKRIPDDCGDLELPCGAESPERCSLVSNCNEPTLPAVEVKGGTLTVEGYDFVTAGPVGQIHHPCLTAFAVTDANATLELRNAYIEESPWAVWASTGSVTVRRSHLHGGGVRVDGGDLHWEDGRSRGLLITNSTLPPPLFVGEDGRASVDRAMWVDPKTALRVAPGGELRAEDVSVIIQLDENDAPDPGRQKSDCEGFAFGPPPHDTLENQCIRQRRFDLCFEPLPYRDGSAPDEDHFIPWDVSLQRWRVWDWGRTHPTKSVFRMGGTGTFGARDVELLRTAGRGLFAQGQVSLELDRVRLREGRLNACTHAALMFQSWPDRAPFNAALPHGRLRDVSVRDFWVGIHAEAPPEVSWDLRLQDVSVEEVEHGVVSVRTGDPAAFIPPPIVPWNVSTRYRQVFSDYSGPVVDPNCF